MSRSRPIISVVMMQSNRTSPPSSPWAHVAVAPLPDPMRLRDTIEMEARPHFTIWICALGHGTLLLLDRSIKLEPRSVVLIPPCVAARAQSDQCELEIVESLFDMRVRNRFVRDARGQIDVETWTLHIPGTPKLSMISKSMPGSMGDRFLRAAHFYPDADMRQLELLSQVLRAVAMFRAAYIEGPDRLASMPDFVHRAANFLCRHLDKKSITLQDVADHTGVSRTHLVRMFRKEYQTSPMRYLLDQRMAKARTLLEGPSFKIRDIADRLGFSSPEVFSLAFKDRHGVSPRTYRQNRCKRNRDAPDSREP